MRKLIWASLDDYLPPGVGFQQVGRNIANHNFFQALLKYSRFDEYHFFLANSAHRKLFETSHRPFLEKIGMNHRVILFERIELPKQLQKSDYTVFHQSDPIALFNSLCHLRNQIGSFPVTAFIHSLSYQSFMGKYLEMSLGGVTSGDSLVCSSISGKRVLENCFHQISDRLGMAPPPVKMEVIPLGFDGERFCPGDRIESRKKLGLDDREVIGLCFGRFSDYDKMDLFPLLQAFQAIDKKDLPWRLILAGAVHSEDYLRVLELWARALGVANRVTFLTNLSDEDKVALYRSADFFISLSDNPQETFGLTLLEAMACGLPLVVSDFDGYREIVTDEVGRRIQTTWSEFEPLVMLGPLMDEVTYHRYLAQSVSVDLDQLGDVLRFFFSHPHLCRDMGKAARDRFLRLYDYRVVIPALEKLWLRLKENSHFEPGEFRLDPLAMNVFRCFSHYVTQTLDPGMKIKLTHFGQGLLDSKTEYPLLAEMAGLVDHEEMKTIMKHAQTPCLVDDLLADHLGGVWKKRYRILWMLKHGILGFVG